MGAVTNFMFGLDDEFGWAHIWQPDRACFQPKWLAQFTRSRVAVMVPAALQDGLQSEVAWKLLVAKESHEVM